MASRLGQQEESRDILSDHAYPLTNKDSTADILEVVESFVSDNYSRDVGIIMMRDNSDRQFLRVSSKQPDRFLVDNSDRQFLRVSSKQPDRFLVDDSVLHLNIRVSEDKKLSCELLGHNRQLYNQTELDRERLVDVGLIIEDLARDRYKSCEGLALDHAQMDKYFDQLNNTDLGHLLIEKYDNNIVYRSKSCGFIIDREESVEGGNGVCSNNCPECVILASCLLDTLDIKPGHKVSHGKKKRGRPKGSRTKHSIENVNELKKTVKIEESIKRGEVKVEVEGEECDNFEDDSEDYSPELMKKPKIQSPITKSAKHFCPHDSCSLVFVSLQQMKSHLESHEFVNCGRAAVMCSSPRCSAVFHSDEELLDHLPSHSEKKHSCSICSKSFGTKQDLKIHSRTHSGDKPFSCEICSKEFARNAALRIHKISVHSDVKAYLCADCGAAFKANSALIDHRKRVHLQIKPHKCDYCGKEFFSKKDFGEHVRTHTGEKPYQCQLCGKCFGRGYHLSRHKEGVHKTGGGKAIKPPNSPCGELTIDSVEIIQTKNIKKIKNSSTSEIQSSHLDVKPLVTFEEKFPEIKLYERLPLDLVQRNSSLSLEAVQIVDEDTFHRDSPSPIGETLEIHEGNRDTSAASHDTNEMFSYTITNPTYIVGNIYRSNLGTTQTSSENKT